MQARLSLLAGINRYMPMNLIRQYKKHIIVILLLILIASLMEYVMTIYYDKLLQEPLYVGYLLSLRPVYNESGSWYHARLGIGYAQGLLIAENVAALLIVWLIYRFMEIWGWFFGMRSFWLYLLDFALAPTLYRLFHSVPGIYTLDYIRIVDKRGTVTFDFPDFYLGISVVAMLVWLVFALIPYYKYKQTQAKSMRLLSRFAWEFHLMVSFTKAVFIPKERWAELFEKAGYGR